MKITIVGVGEVGAYYAEKWHRAGHDLTLTYYRDQHKLEAFAAKLGERVSIALPGEATREADVILFCPRFEHIDDAAEKLGDVGQKILIDANNPFNPERTGLAALTPGDSASKQILRHFPHARHVKALHNLGIQTILQHQPNRLAGFVAGDDEQAVEIVMSLLNEADLDPIHTGDFATAPLSEFPGPLFGHAFTKEAGETALKQALSETNNQ